jgi:predicted nucleic acid-binding protein
MTYLLDADVLIRAKNDHYSFEMVPAFWDWLDRANRNGLVHSVQRVREELLAGDDELADWVRLRGGEFFLPADSDTVAALAAISNWATDQARFLQAAKATFLDSADLYLVAHAVAHGNTVVTHEKVEPLARARIKIPDVCQGVGVPYMGSFEMLRAENVRFVLAT